MVNGVCQKWLKIADQKLVLLVSAVFWSFSYYFTAMIFLNLLIFFLANFHVKNRIWRKSFFSKLLNWYSNLHATNITKMYSTSIKIVTSYKAINLPYENNVSSSSLLWFSSTPFPFAPDFCLYLSWIQHLPDEKWMQIEDLEKIRQKTSNHRLWLTFFFLFFPGGVRKDPTHLVSDWLTDT